MERTLIIFKPDAVMRGLVGEVLTRFEKVGLKIVGVKMLMPNYEHLHKHYEGIGTLKTRKGEKIFEETATLMQEGPVIAMVFEGIESVELVRKMVGATEPKQAVPGTIRGDYAHASFAFAGTKNMSVPNLIHASATKEEADQEVSHWFSQDELYDYENVHEKFTHLTRK